MPGPIISSDTFIFIDLPRPVAIRDQTKVRTARSHAISTALARQRQKAQQQGENFRFHPSLKRCRPDIVDEVRVQPFSLRPSIDALSIDPFNCLAVDSRRLTHLLHARSSLRAGEPVFSVNDAVRYQSLHTVFGSGLTDGALTAALSLTLCYAANGWTLNQESMQYSTVALQQIRYNLANPVLATSAVTIGAILLLLGNEYRLGNHDRVQAHLKGIGVILSLCSQHDVKLSPALRRAIYWQDLFSSIFVQTRRIVQFSDFYPICDSTLHVRDDILVPPPGLMKKARELGAEFMDLAAEVASLYRNRTKWIQSGNNRQAPENLGTIQARIEGRLHDLRQSAQQGIAAACYIALHLCIYGFWDSIWNAALIPRGLSTQLLHQLRLCATNAIQDDMNTLFWLVHIGKAFAIDAPIRDGFDQVWKSRLDTTTATRGMSNFLPKSPGAIEILKTFIWSDIFYNGKDRWFWERLVD